MKALRFLLAILLLIGAGTVNAQQGEIVIVPKNEGQGSEGGNNPRGPIDSLVVYYEDYVLMFDSSCIGCTIELVQDDEVVFTGVVDTNGEVEIPDTLVGMVELRIRKNGITYIGEFEP